MRIWNGLRIGDIVLYKGFKYYIIKLYEIENKRVCDLKKYDTGEKILIQIRRNYEKEN